VSGTSALPAAPAMKARRSNVDCLEPGVSDIDASAADLSRQRTPAPLIAP
jgi:hypothetical protein